MSPIKTMSIKEDNGWSDIFVIGVGKAGETAVRSLSHPAYIYQNDAYLKSFLFGDERLRRPAEYQDRLFLETENSECLFVLVDTTDCENLKSACNIADLFKKRACEIKHSVCVCCCKKGEKSILPLQDKYDNIIHCSSETLLHKVPILYADMLLPGLVGLDFADVITIFNKMPSSSYYQFELSDISAVEKEIEALEKKMKSETLKTTNNVNALVRINMTPDTSLDVIDELTKKIYKITGTNMIWTLHPNNDATDKNLHVSMIYGADIDNQHL